MARRAGDVRKTADSLQGLLVRRWCATADGAIGRGKRRDEESEEAGVGGRGSAWDAAAIKRGLFG